MPATVCFSSSSLSFTHTHTHTLSLLFSFGAGDQQRPRVPLKKPLPWLVPLCSSSSSQLRVIARAQRFAHPFGYAAWLRISLARVTAGSDCGGPDVQCHRSDARVRAKTPQDPVMRAHVAGRGLMCVCVRVPVCVCACVHVCVCLCVDALTCFSFAFVLLDFFF